MTLYIHIPFCIKKCNYCDFYSLPIDPNKNLVEVYVEALCKELKIKTRKDKKLYSIFIGGGTPTSINDLYIEKIFEVINKYYELDKNCEISIEANPATNINFKKLKDIGINRISIGVQSFVDKELLLLGRIHDSYIAKKTIIEAEKYFDNINADIIFSIPEQTKESLLKTLNTIKELNIQHVSAYSLIFEQGTKIYDLLKYNLVKCKTEDEDFELYQTICEFLHKNNYTHYEVSNFSKHNFECKHNLNYWKRGEYLGVGAAAHSFTNNNRYSNYSNISKYCSLLKQDILPVCQTETLTKEEIQEEELFLGLRSIGINIKKYSQSIYDLCKLYESLNYGKIENNIFKLNSRGYFLCDEIVVKLLEKENNPN